MSEENLKAIQAKAFKPKTTDSKGTQPMPNLLAEVKIEKRTASKIIIGAHYLHPAAERQVLLFGSLAG